MKSPGRRATAKKLEGRQAPGLFYFMQGAPEAVEEDKQFYALFGEWARKGRDPKSPLVERMRQRWDEVMYQQTKKDENGGRIRKLRRAGGRINAVSATR